MFVTWKQIAFICIIAFFIFLFYDLKTHDTIEKGDDKLPFSNYLWK
ncbi:hypothetical protein HMPREF1018_03005 [Bacteroides fragilis]|nr:hypothetical protein HMPREF1018_03005 [Bacteroides fragilis]